MIPRREPLPPSNKLPVKKSKPLISEPQAYRYALWLLNRRAYSTGELRDKFTKRTLSPGLQELVLEKLKAKKFLDDGVFTELFIRNRKDRHWGPRKIETALFKKKIPREMIQRALRSVFPSGDEKQNALEYLARQKQRFLRKKEKKKGETKRKAWEFLVRKGYSLEAARLAVREVFGYNPELPPEEN